MSHKKIVDDAVRVARVIVDRGFWVGHGVLTAEVVAEVTRSGTLFFADLQALEERIGRKLTRKDHWLWETSLRTELGKLAPVISQ